MEIVITVHAPYTAYDFNGTLCWIYEFGLVQWYTISLRRDSRENMARIEWRGNAIHCRFETVVYNALKHITNYTHILTHIENNGQCVKVWCPWGTYTTTKFNCTQICVYQFTNFKKENISVERTQVEFKYAFIQHIKIFKIIFAWTSNYIYLKVMGCNNSWMSFLQRCF